MSIAVTFNANNLENIVPGLKISATDPYRQPNRDLDLKKISNSDKSVMSAAYYKDKKVNVTCTIGRTSRALLDDSLDTLRKYLQGEEQALVFDFGSSTRQWTATLSNIKIDDVLGGYAEVDIEFTCADPMGVDTSNTTLYNSSRTASTATENLYLLGTHPKQQPVITITLTAVSGGSGKAITIGNPATGESVVITRDWVAADVLVINSKTKKVTVNGTEVDFEGAIPEWSLGAGTLSYSDNFTTRTYTNNGVYQKRYV